MGNKNNERLTMTCSEFAELAGISRNLAFRLARQDQLGVPVLRFGEKRMLIPRRAAEEYLGSGNNQKEKKEE